MAEGLQIFTFREEKTADEMSNLKMGRIIELHTFFWLTPGGLSVCDYMFEFNFQATNSSLLWQEK